MVSTSDSGISYGLFAKADPNTPNFAKNRCLNENGENLYELAYGRPVEDDTMVVPFIASAFTGVFYAQTPNSFAAGESIEYTTYLVVGDGDAASVMDVAYRLRGETTGLLTGKVLDEKSLSPVAGASVLVYDADDRPINQFYANDDGQIRGTLPVGKYTARVFKAPLLSQLVSFEIAEGEGEHIVLSAPTAAQIAVTVRDGAGQLLPAKVTVVGTTPADKAGLDPRDYLFDMKAGGSIGGRPIWCPIAPMMHRLDSSSKPSHTRKMGELFSRCLLARIGHSTSREELNTRWTESRCECSSGPSSAGDLRAEA